jgi:hypothetical protein
MGRGASSSFSFLGARSGKAKSWVIAATKSSTAGASPSLFQKTAPPHYEGSPTIAKVLMGDFRDRILALLRDPATITVGRWGTGRTRFNESNLVKCMAVKLGGLSRAALQ